MQDQELTGWFVNGEKPVRDGVYQTTNGPWLGYQKFQAGKWYGWYETPKDAAASKHIIREACQNDQWRGLSSDPNAKPKPKRSGNPKVTRYVVIYVMKGEPVASFHTRDAAVDYAERMAWPRIKRVRQRSPE